MPELSLSTVAAVIGARVGSTLPQAVTATGYSIDTRSLEPGDLFFALKGGARDGHEFVEAAQRRGAAGAVVERETRDMPADFAQLVVPSALEALQRLARHVRSHSNAAIVAVTGSNGKTTVKEMIAHLAATRMAVRKSPGNFNNHIGLPLAILGLEERDQILIVELGSNHRGEIAALCEIARPQVGVVTNVGRAHIGQFGSIEEIAAEKTDLLRSLGAGGKAVVNADDRMLMGSLAGTRADLVRFGINGDAEFRATDVDVAAGAGAAFKIKGVAFRLGAPGIHNVYNALAAVATASLYGVTLEQAAEAMARYEPMRMRTVAAGGVSIIDDAYNANPDSVAAALEVLARIEAGRRVFIMGEMLELGPEAGRLHAEVGRKVAALGIDVLVGVEGLTRKAVDEAAAAGRHAPAATWFETKAEAKQALGRMLKPGDVVLVKASRGAGLEEIIDFLKTGAVAGRV
jgi:UDP-N-acetylmuramoyl-tripeptide--D-alanyl-D-alanine ligase